MEIKSFVITAEVQRYHDKPSDVVFETSERLRNAELDYLSECSVWCTVYEALSHPSVMLQRWAAGGSSICCRGDGPVMLETQSLELHVDVSADAEQRQQQTHAQQQTTHTRPAAAQRVHLSLQSVHSARSVSICGWQHKQILLHILECMTYIQTASSRFLRTRDGKPDKSMLKQTKN